MSLHVRVLKGHYREEDGSLTQGSLVLIDVPGKAICTEEGPASRSSFKDSTGVEGVELYDLDFEFLPDEGECERVGIPVDRIN